MYRRALSSLPLAMESTMQNKGNFRVIDALADLAAFNYPNRSTFFQYELIRVFSIDHGRTSRGSLKREGSYAGAIGWPQFASSHSIRSFGVDHSEMVSLIFPIT